MQDPNVTEATTPLDDAACCASDFVDWNKANDDIADMYGEKLWEEELQRVKDPEVLLEKANTDPAWKRIFKQILVADSLLQLNYVRNNS